MTTHGLGDHYPRPEHLVLLAPHLRRLRDAAAEYDAIAIDGELTTAAEFIEWLQLDVERALRHQLPAWHRERIGDAQRQRHAQRKSG